jgi:hypothetical protein
LIHNRQQKTLREDPRRVFLALIDNLHNSAAGRFDQDHPVVPVNVSIIPDAWHFGVDSLWHGMKLNVGWKRGTDRHAPAKGSSWDALIQDECPNSLALQGSHRRRTAVRLHAGFPGLRGCLRIDAAWLLSTGAYAASKQYSRC